MTKNNSIKIRFNEKLKQLDKEYLDLLRQYHTDISNNLKAYTEKRINRNDYEFNRTKIKENFCKEKNLIHSKRIKAKYDYKNFLKISALEKENKSYECDIEAVRGIIQTLNNQSEKIQIISYKTYLEKKSIIVKISKNTLKLNYLLAKYTRNKYDIYELQLFDNNSKDSNADKLYKFICYVENNNKDNKIFPYKLNSLIKLNSYTRWLMLLTIKLIWLRDIKLKGLILQHSSTYRMRKKIKKLEKKIKHYENDIENFFKDSVENGFRKLELFTEYLTGELNNGKRVEITISGFASPLHKADYNMKLSSRRIASFKNYLLEYKNVSFAKYISNGQLIIHEKPQGQQLAKKYVSDNPNDKKNSVYIIAASLERKIQITEYKIISEKTLKSEDYSE